MHRIRRVGRCAPKAHRGKIPRPTTELQWWKAEIPDACPAGLEFLREALELSKTVDTMTHYELLGLEANASEKSYATSGSWLASSRGSLFSARTLQPVPRFKVFIALIRREILHDPTERQEYDLGSSLNAPLKNGPA